MARRAKSDTVQLKTRMKEPLRAKLEAAAEENGVTLNAEAVQRLERSFVEEKSLAAIAKAIAEEAVGGVYAAFGNLETFLVARYLASAIHTIEAVTGKNWMDDPDAHRQTQEACLEILDRFRPPVGARPIRIDPKDAEGSTVGVDAANKALMSGFDLVARPAEYFRKKKGG